MVSRKRRVIEEEEEEEDVGHDEQHDSRDGAGSSTVKQNMPDTDNGSDSFATSMVDRLKRRAAKTAEVAQHKKRAKLEIDDGSKDSQCVSPPPSTAIKKKETSIPKKPKRMLTIPKKSNDDTNDKNNKDEKFKKEMSFSII